jgi:hypothetical protein
VYAAKIARPPASKIKTAPTQIAKIFLFLRPLISNSQYLEALGIATAKIKKVPRYKC